MKYTLLGYQLGLHLLTLKMKYVYMFSEFCRHKQNELEVERGTEIHNTTVVVVNHCFTSLFGTKGLLSDIIIR